MFERASDPPPRDPVAGSVARAALNVCASPAADQDKPAFSARTPAKRHTIGLHSRAHGVPALDEAADRLARAAAGSGPRLLPVLDGDLPARPKTRADCEGGERPCPWVGCRHNAFLIATEAGGLHLTWPTLEPGEVDPTLSCVLDVAAEGPHSLDEVSQAFGVTRERIRQVEGKALERMGRKGARLAEHLDGHKDRFDRPVRPSGKQGLGRDLQPSTPEAEERGIPLEPRSILQIPCVDGVVDEAAPTARGYAQRIWRVYTREIAERKAGLPPPAALVHVEPPAPPPTSPADTATPAPPAPESETTPMSSSSSSPTQRVLDMLSGDPVGIQTVMERTDLDGSNARATLQRLVAQGRANRHGDRATGITWTIGADAPKPAAPAPKSKTITRHPNGAPPPAPPPAAAAVESSGPSDLGSLLELRLAAAEREAARCRAALAAWRAA